MFPIFVFLLCSVCIDLFKTQTYQWQNKKNDTKLWTFLRWRCTRATRTSHTLFELPRSLTVFFSCHNSNGFWRGLKQRSYSQQRRPRITWRPSACLNALAAILGVKLWQSNRNLRCYVLTFACFGKNVLVFSVITGSNQHPLKNNRLAPGYKPKRYPSLKYITFRTIKICNHWPTWHLLAASLPILTAVDHRFFCLHPIEVGKQRHLIFLLLITNSFMATTVQQSHRFFPSDVSKQCEFDSQKGRQWQEVHTEHFMVVIMI